MVLSETKLIKGHDRIFGPKGTITIKPFQIKTDEKFKKPLNKYLDLWGFREGVLSRIGLRCYESVTI